MNLKNSLKTSPGLYVEAVNIELLLKYTTPKLKRMYASLA